MVRSACFSAWLQNTTLWSTRSAVVAAGSPRELIARYVTREVLEVRMTDEVRAANAGRLATLGTHLEHLPERLQF